jgi:ribose transport system substrate-binding protein
MKLKSTLIVFSMLLMMFTSCNRNNEVAVSPVADGQSPLVGSPNEEYYMVTFISGDEFWKTCYKGFSDAAKLYGVKTVYEGSPEYDVNKAVTVLDQVIAQNPTGLAITCMNPDAYEAPIKRAIDKGIPVVVFDSDSPKSGRYSFLSTGNYGAGAVAARHMAKILGESGEVAILTLPGQLNHEQRAAGFKETIEKEFPDMKVVQVGNGGNEQVEAAKAMSGIIQANPNLKGVFSTATWTHEGAITAVKEANKVGDIQIICFDAQKGVLNAIKEGSVAATISQGGWNMGFWSLQFLFQLKHELLTPMEHWKENGVNPLPPAVDTGVTVVTKDNVDAFINSKQY